MVLKNAKNAKNSILPNQRSKLVLPHRCALEKDRDLRPLSLSFAHLCDNASLACVLDTIFFNSSGGMIDLPSIFVLRDKKNIQQVGAKICIIKIYYYYYYYYLFLAKNQFSNDF